MRITLGLAFLWSMALGGTTEVAAQNELARLREAEAALVRAAAAQDAQAAASFFAEDSILLPPDAPPIQGKEAIRDLITKNLAVEGFSLQTELLRAEASRSTDLGYTLAAYEAASTGPEGNPVNHHGHVLRIWRRQPNHSWKVVVETWSSNPLRPPTTTEP